MPEKTCSGELATSSSRTTDLESDTDSTDFSQLAQVADAREEALKDAGFETVHDVANAEVDELSAVLSNAGETTAKRIKGSAQGRSKLLERESGFQFGDEADADAEDDADADDVEGEAAETDGEAGGEETPSSVERGPRNILLTAGKGAWAQKDADEAFALIEQALEKANLELKDGDTVGVPAGSTREPELIKNYQTDLVRSGKLLGLETFHADESDRPSDDPYNDNWGQAYEARDERMFEWADHVVVVEAGPFTDLMLSRNPETGGARTYVYIEDSTEPLYYVDHVDSARARALRRKGVETIRDIADLTVEEIAELLPDVSENLATQIRRDAHKREYGQEPPETELSSHEQGAVDTDPLIDDEDDQDAADDGWFDDEDPDDDWYDGKAAPESDPDRGPGHVWVADRDEDRDAPSQYKYEGGEPGDPTLL